MAIIVTLIQPTKRRGVKSQTWFGQWRDERGKLHKKTTGTRDKSVARTIVREWERRLALDAQYIHDFDRYKRLTWAAVVEEFVNLHTGHPATLDLYRRAGKQFDRVMKAPLLCRITTATIEKFAAVRSKEVKETTVNKELRHIRAVLNFAHESGRRYIREVPKIEFLREDEYIRRHTRGRLSEDSCCLAVGRLAGSRPTMVGRACPSTMGDWDAIRRNREQIDLG